MYNRNKMTYVTQYLLDVLHDDFVICADPAEIEQQFIDIGVNMSKWKDDGIWEIDTVKMCDYLDSNYLNITNCTLSEAVWNDINDVTIADSLRSILENRWYHEQRTVWFVRHFKTKE